MYKRAHGFTIVELLIVVVVIAILAAITLVSYKGVNDRANAARATAAVNAYVKLLKIYKQDNGTYPSSASAPTGEWCLGNPSDFPAEGVFAAGQCLYNPGSYAVFASQTFNDSLTSLVGPVSNTRITNARLGSETWRGIRYNYDPALSYPAALEWVVNGSVPCTPGTGSPGSWWGSTWCTLTL